MESTPSPSPTNAAVDIALSNYWLAIAVLLTAILVIVLALTFAWIYHRRALETIEKLDGKATVANETAVETRGFDAGTQATTRQIVGSVRGQANTGLMYVIDGWEPGDAVEWKIAEADADVEVVNDRTAIVTFKRDGAFAVKATVTNAGGAQDVAPLAVVISAPAATGGSIVIPFVVRNWGRLVIVVFGAGIIAALMATKVLSEAAGIGILGTLLGAGAASSSGGGAETATTASDPAKTEPPKPAN